MNWIGGVHAKVPTNLDEIRRQANLMTEAVCFPRPAKTDGQRWIKSIAEEGDGKILVQLSTDNGASSKERRLYRSQQGKLTILYDGYFYEFEDRERKRTRDDTGFASDVCLEQLCSLLACSAGGLEQRLKQALIRTDGDYALAISEAGETVISRNALGTKPLYIAEDGKFWAFASSKRPLWKIGLPEVMSLKAGVLAIFNGGKVTVERGVALEEEKIEIRDMSQAISRYRHALCSALRKRLDKVDGINRIGVLLSGGVDSCLIAKLLHDAVSAQGGEVVAYSVGLVDSPDLNFACKFAKEMGIKHKARMLTISDVEKYIPEVVEAVEDSDFVQVEAGIGIFAALDVAVEDGIEVVFSGQGPDELWGGYNWYPKVLARDGREELRRRMWEDFARADIETLDRENKIALAHGVDIFFPYLDWEVVDVAWSVASELKVMSEKDYLGKHPHRQLALRIGVPPSYAYREKLAIQHGTGIHGVLDIIANRNGFDASLINRIGYTNEAITEEKMGSSSRYGYRYGGRELWQVPSHVQFFLHTVAYKRGLLNSSVRKRIESFLSKADFCL